MFGRCVKISVVDNLIALLRRMRIIPSTVTTACELRSGKKKYKTCDQLSDDCFYGITTRVFISVIDALIIIHPTTSR
jgi:hypothetical protein